MFMYWANCSISRGSDSYEVMSCQDYGKKPSIQCFILLILSFCFFVKPEPSTRSSSLLSFPRVSLGESSSEQTLSSVIWCSIRDSPRFNSFLGYLELSFINQDFRPRLLLFMIPLLYLKRLSSFMGSTPQVPSILFISLIFWRQISSSGLSWVICRVLLFRKQSSPFEASQASQKGGREAMSPCLTIGKYLQS